METGTRSRSSPPWSLKRSRSSRRGASRRTDEHHDESEKIPIRLNTTCTKVNVVIPKIMRSPFRTILMPCRCRGNYHTCDQSEIRGDRNEGRSPLPDNPVPFLSARGLRIVGKDRRRHLGRSDFPLKPRPFRPGPNDIVPCPKLNLCTDGSLPT